MPCHDSRRAGKQFSILYIFYVSIPLGDPGKSSINITVFIFKGENSESHRKEVDFVSITK